MSGSNIFDYRANTAGKTVATPVVGGTGGGGAGGMKSDADAGTMPDIDTVDDELDYFVLRNPIM